MEKKREIPESFGEIMEDKLVRYDDNFAASIAAVEEQIRVKHQAVSKEVTPKAYIKERQGFDYVEEAYLRHKLNEHFPIWSWEAAGNTPQLLGAEWIIVAGELAIFDAGIKRSFFSVGAARIQYKACECKKRNNGYPLPDCQVCSGTGSLPHTPENVVDIDKNAGAATTNAFKRAINRLCNISDDVYRKFIEDLVMSAEQIEAIMEIANQLGVKTIKYVTDKMDTWEINAANWQDWVSQLKKALKKKQVKEEKKDD